MMLLRALALALFAAAFVGLMPADRAEARFQRPKATVRLVIDYGEGVEIHYTAIPHHPGMTLEQAMHAAKEMTGPRALRFESKGAGERAFLVSIDGLANEGAGRDRRNWLYWINDRPGERSFALAALEPGDTAAWRFASYALVAPSE